MQEKRPRILAIDDDPIWLEQIPVILEEVCEVQTLATIDQGLKAIELEFYEVVLLDLNFDGDPRTGIEIFNKIHALDQGIDVIVISAETNPKRLVEAFNAGISRFLAKPVSPAEVRSEVSKVLRLREERRHIAGLSAPLLNGRSNPLFGNSPAMRKVQEDVARLINSSVRDLLIQGETGTGKELLARYVAIMAATKANFLPIHCGAIADGVVESELFGHVKGAFTGADRDRVGVFEGAMGGFVFLDEIGEMPLSQQAKLLRVLQERVVQRVGCHMERKVNFRCLAATHVDLDAAIAENRFREDLYYRIARSKVTLPPLRERKEDIPVLAKSFLSSERTLPAEEFTDGALELLMQYDWPGNIRQLKAVIEDLQSRVKDRIIREKDVFGVLPGVASAGPGLRRLHSGSFTNSLALAERKRFENAIVQCNGDRDEAARILGLSRATYFRRAKELGLVNRRRIGI
jgi:DNA-binding NtrC family response regulator